MRIAGSTPRESQIWVTSLPNGVLNVRLQRQRPRAVVARTYITQVLFSLHSRTVLSVTMSLPSERCSTHEAMLYSNGRVMHGRAGPGISFAIWHAFCYLVK